MPQIKNTYPTHFDDTHKKWNLNPIDSFFISWIIQHFFLFDFHIFNKMKFLQDFFLAILIEPLYVIQHKIHTGTQIIHI